MPRPFLRTSRRRIPCFLLGVVSCALFRSASTSDAGRKRAVERTPWIYTDAILGDLWRSLNGEGDDTRSSTNSAVGRAVKDRICFLEVNPKAPKAECQLITTAVGLSLSDAPEAPLIRGRQLLTRSSTSTSIKASSQQQGLRPSPL